MSVHDITQELRSKDKFHHIDMGFLNQRRCLLALPDDVRTNYLEGYRPEVNHVATLANNHKLVTLLLDYFEKLGTPTLLEAIKLGKSGCLFRSTERLAPCPEIYDAPRVCHAVQLDVDFGKPVLVAYHTSHLVSETGKMVLAMGEPEGYVNSMVGLLHDKNNRFEVEPFIIGAPWFDHPRNGEDGEKLMFHGKSFGEIQPEDIDQFSRMSEVDVASAQEWLEAMQQWSEEDIKKAFAGLLCEPTKKDWGGEANDHFSGNVLVSGQRKTAAFLLKGPSDFREMTLDMCGKRSDQIHRMVDSKADISIVQHVHLIDSIVRRTLRNLIIYPGGSSRKYCLIDGQATYRILKAYSFL